jgi:hypothetical protein
MTGLGEEEGGRVYVTMYLRSTPTTLCVPRPPQYSPYLHIPAVGPPWPPSGVPQAPLTTCRPHLHLMH